MTASSMSLENMSMALTGVYWADLTIFATAPTCKPDKTFSFLFTVLLTFDIH